MRPAVNKGKRLRPGLELGIVDRLPLLWRLRRLRARNRAFCTFLDTWADQ
jgi:hypothetical protein